MKASCLQENLSKSLTIVGHAVATRSTLPILTNVLLAADQGRLKLSATNLEVGLTCWIGAKVEEEGSTTVPARTFLDLVGAMPQERVDLLLVQRTQTLNMRCGRFENNLRGIDPAEFPLIPTVDAKAVIRVEPGLLRTAINQAVFAAATDDKRPVLAGVLACFHNDPQSGHGRATFAAADGFRLAVRTIPLSEPVPDTINAIVPAKAMALLARTASAQESPISIHATPSKSQAIFHLENVELVTQLIDGTFPDYNLIIPKKKETRFVARTSEVLKTCKAASVFARDSSNIVRFSVTPGSDLQPGSVTVQATSAEAGDNAGRIDANVEGPAIQIAFNVGFVIDALSAVGTEQVAVELTTPARPGTFRPVGQEDNYLCVIMPMNINR